LKKLKWKRKKKTKKKKKKKDNKKKAVEEKNFGNDFYKKKQFEDAIRHYSNAVDLDPEEMVYYLNRSAVYLEKGNFEKSILEAEQSIIVGKKQFASYESISKAYTRIGTCYFKMEKYDLAINNLNEAITEHRNKQNLELLEKIQKIKKQKDEEAYYSFEKSLEEKEKGNEYFKKQKLPESIKCYEEAIKRNPKDPSLYSNRATSYIKLAEYSYALKDIDKSLFYEPKNVKYLQKKAQIEYFSKQYHKALDTLNFALELEPNNEQLHEAYSKVSQAAQNPEYDEERVEKAKNDPEIKMILSDVTIMKVLEAAKK